MKILHVILSMAEVDGGPPNGLLTLSKAQVNLGEEVCILPCTSLRGKSIIEPGKYGDLTVLKPPTSASLKLHNKNLSDVLTDITGNFDIVHIHGFWRSHVMAATNAACKCNIPVILRPAGCLGQKPRRRKYILKLPYLYIFKKNTFSNISAVHCCSIKEKNELPIWIDTKKTFVVSQPVEQELLYFKCDYSTVYKLCPGIEPNSILLLYLGRISRIKQIPMLVESFTSVYEKLKNKNIHLVIAGPFEDNKIVERLKTKIKPFGMRHNVHFPGFIKNNIKASFLSRADFFVQPSKHENFGISVAEALSFGKPCIVNNGVALSSEINKYKAGLCFDNTQQLTESMIKMILDNDFTEKCSSNALTLAKNFKADLIAGQLRNYYAKSIREIM